MSARIWWISPVRNEAEHIERVARALAAQTVPPARWTVVDDGSTDDTRAIVERLAAELPFLRIVSTPPGHTRDRGDRLAAAAPDRAFAFGLEQEELATFTHVGKLDGDIVLPPAYDERLLERFAAERALGMASGGLTELRDGEWRVLPTPADQVAAPCRLFAVECFEAIGGWPAMLGADVITTTRARMRGFATRTFEDLPVQHLRPVATADGALRGRARHGAYQYIVGYPWWWVALRSVLVGARFRPRVLSGLWFAGGYGRAMVGSTQSVPDPRFHHFMRIETSMRARRAVKGIAGRLRR